MIPAEVMVGSKLGPYPLVRKLVQGGWGLFILGLEMANAYTEPNDPRLQEETFRTQLAGLAEEDSMAKMDHKFVHALKIGRPPTDGMGISRDAADKHEHDPRRHGLPAAQAGIAISASG